MIVWRRLLSLTVALVVLSTVLTRLIILALPSFNNVGFLVIFGVAFGWIGIAATENWWFRSST